MNRYRNAPSIRGPTKATASTLCQKCLKRDIYECTASTQERPYTSRPSRTQQLRNPNLRPKLSTDVPAELLPSKGTADEILAKRAEERGRKREIGESDPSEVYDQVPKRARSESSHSMSSVSTISTSRSHSRSPPRPEGYNARREHERAPSTSSHHSRARKRRYSDSLSGHSDSSDSSGGRQPSRSREWARDRNTRRRRQESSPEIRGRPRKASEEGSRRDRTRSINMDQNRIAKEGRSATPDTDRARYPLERDTGETTIRRSNHIDNLPNNGYSRAAPHASRRERSLSPYSKRLALTQAMNIGR